MTREKAIELLRSWDGVYIGYSSDEVEEAHNMAISALEQEPLENIRAEIASHIGGCGFLNDGLDLALEIINKHIEGR